MIHIIKTTKEINTRAIEGRKAPVATYTVPLCPKRHPRNQKLQPQPERPVELIPAVDAPLGVRSLAELSHFLSAICRSTHLSFFQCPLRSQLPLFQQDRPLHMLCESIIMNRLALMIHPTFAEKVTQQGNTARQILSLQLARKRLAARLVPPNPFWDAPGEDLGCVVLEAKPYAPYGTVLGFLSTFERL